MTDSTSVSSDSHSVHNLLLKYDADGLRQECKTRNLRVTSDGRRLKPADLATAIFEHDNRIWQRAADDKASAIRGERLTRVRTALHDRMLAAGAYGKAFDDVEDAHPMTHHAWGELYATHSVYDDYKRQLKDARDLSKRIAECEDDDNKLAYQADWAMRQMGETGAEIKVLLDKLRSKTATLASFLVEYHPEFADALIAADAAKEDATA